MIGPDAAKLVDFHSYNRLSTLKPGRIRYGFILSETGIVYDDGVTLRLADDRFLVSCSSGHTDAVVTRLELWRQDRFDPRHIVIHDATAQWATLTVTGPRSRDCVAALDLGLKLDDEALPHMAFATGVFEDAPLRVARVSFTGDRSYELSVPSRARSLRAKIVAALPAFGGGLLGSEALMILRAEKGYVIVGKDTDGATMPHDLGAAGPRDQRKDEYIGKRSLTCPLRRTRIASSWSGSRWPGRSAFTDRSAPIEGSDKARRSLGYVTSSYSSPSSGARGARPRRRRFQPGRTNRSRSIISARSGAPASPRRSRSIRRDSGCMETVSKETVSMRETNWTPSRGAEGTLVARPAFAGRALKGLGQTLISGDLDAALKALVRGAPLIGLYEPAPRGKHALQNRTRPGAARHAGADRRGGGLARDLVRDLGRRRLGRGRSRGARRRARSDARDLCRPHVRLAVHGADVRRPALPARPDRSGIPAACRAASTRSVAGLAR